MTKHGTRPNDLMIIPSGSVNNKYITLIGDVFNCYKCPGLNIPRTTMSAPGYGSVPAECMVIGQSLHGYNPETPDRQIPFIGPVARHDSGKMLYEILRQAGYTIANGNLFVTNVVKCHPPNNRSSLPKEISNCQPYLVRELQLVKPKIIVVVGADARRALNLNQQCKHIEYAEWEKIHVAKTRLIPLTTYYVIIKHPSAILRFGTTRSHSQYIKRCVEVLNDVHQKIH